MASLSLPLEPCSSIPRNFLYCDSSWNTLRLSPQPRWRFSSRELADAAQVERLAFRNVEHFFTTAEYVRTDLIEHYGIEPSRVTAVGTGRGSIEPAEGGAGISDGLILFCAKVRFEEKGGRLLLDAFRTAHAANGRLRLVLVGHESYPGLVRDVPGAEGHGSVPWPRLQTMFHEAALFAMPALNEPWGIVYLEALASRTPILGLRRNALPEITCDGQFGFLVDEPTPEAVAAALLDAFSDPARLYRMGAAGQKFCLLRYSWDRVAGQILSTLDVADDAG